MHLFDLNDDVLYYTFSFVNERSVVNFIATSKTSRMIAIRHLSTNVWLKRDHKQVLDFCSFMLADDGNRIPMLRHLHIVRGAIIPACNTVTYEPNAPPTCHFGPALANVLTKAYNLMTLGLEQFETLLLYEPQLCDIIPRCSSLSSVSFTRMRSQARNVAIRLKNLRHVVLDTEEELFSLIQHSQTSLMTISTTLSLRQPAGGVGQWPHVRTLKIREILPVDTKALVQAFPNLRNFRLAPTIKCCRIYSSIRRRDRDSTQRVWWPCLKYVEGTVFDLHAMGLPCRIGHLKLTSIPYALATENVPSLSYGEAILDLIRDAQPIALSFRACSPIGVPPFDAMFYTQLCMLAPHLQFIGIDLTKNVCSRLVRTVPRFLISN